MEGNLYITSGHPTVIKKLRFGREANQTYLNLPEWRNHKKDDSRKDAKPAKFVQISRQFSLHLGLSTKMADQP